MNFKLSGATKKYLAESSMRPKQFRLRVDLNSHNFYAQHPDLAPRDVYLRMGRVMDLKTVERYIANIGKETLWDKIGNWFSNLFNKKK